MKTNAPRTTPLELEVRGKVLILAGGCGTRLAEETIVLDQFLRAMSSA